MSLNNFNRPGIKPVAFGKQLEGKEKKIKNTIIIFKI